MRARFRDEGAALSSTWLEQVERYIRKVDFARLPLDVEGPALRDFLGTLAPVDANRARAAIGATLKFARLRRWIAPSAPDPLELVARNRESRQAWTARAGLHHEIDEVVQQLSGEYIDVWQGWAIRILIWTGRRPTEILGAPAEAVDLAAGVLRLPTTKIGRPQVVPLEGPALECARRAVERAKRLGSPWLFPTTCRSVAATPEVMRRCWKRVRSACTSSGVSMVRSDGLPLQLRDLRAIAITEMSRAGVPVPVIAQASGHTQLATVDRYLRLGLDDARVACRALQGSKKNVDAEHNGHRIRAARESRGLSASSCARELGISRAGYCQIEKRGVEKISTLKRVAEVLGVDWKVLA